MSLPAAGVTCMVSPDWVGCARGSAQPIGFLSTAVNLTGTGREGLSWFTFPEGMALTGMGASDSLPTEHLERKQRAVGCGP